MNQSDLHLRDRAMSYLTKDELYSIEKMLGRTPNPFELNMFAAMWSEHISYKSSIKWIEELPVNGNEVYIRAGEENAGAIDLGDNLACVVKIESHNHPIAVDPTQGAVCVGNINRDLIAMGAEPVGHFNILRFGELSKELDRNIINIVIKAIGSYSNNFGVPVAGVEVLFDRSYNFNPLVNIMGIGIVHMDKLCRAIAGQVNQSLILIGKKTSGKGVHGAGFASRGLREGNQMVPDTQVTDPYVGKILMDCILELRDANLITGMQDIGAGGVLCAAVEMASRGNTGIELFLNKIPVVGEDMMPLERMLSQTQEQMILAVDPENLDRVEQIVRKWELECEQVGMVIREQRVRIFNGEEILGDLPLNILVRGGGAPVYIRNIKPRGKKAVPVAAEDIPFVGSLKEIAKKMITLPNISSKKWISEQFDTMAGNSNLGAEYAMDTGVLLVEGTNKAIAVSLNGNMRYGRMEPRKGALISVAGAARNIICSGGTPLAVADCLNFGDPSDPFVYHDFVESIKGISEACKGMRIPVIAGNVSFYNLTHDGGDIVSIIPTPVVGMVGLIDEISNLMTIDFKRKGDMIFLIGRSDEDLSSSEYLSVMHLIEESAAPKFDFEYELKLQGVVSSLIRDKLISSAHDVSTGGLFVTLVESALPGKLGFDITSPAEIRNDAFLFGESQSRVVVSVSSEQETGFIDFMMEAEIHFSALGHVTKEELRIDDVSYGFISDYERMYEGSLGKLLDN
ncbi:MAG: phosphoribosylformylglycinamidine synthase subunit PurL [Bacteroidales bacterium]|nr:phosphoribosylformylglycinamidine synthase subunit PurL [Bacteroidales bacterium]MBN2697758.1 phosphoribosylformylglycinamidine synthase subunit PurL [Bacteroidales bacterium]